MMAISPRVLRRSGSPRTPKPPSAHSRSSSPISSKWAAARRALALILPAAPSTAPASMTVVRDPPGPVAGSPSPLPWYTTATSYGSQSNSSATNWATIVSGLFPQNAQEYKIAVIPPVVSTFSDTDSGVEVTGAPGSSNQNQNSVAENTLRSWAEISPMPM